MSILKTVSFSDFSSSKHQCMRASLFLPLLLCTFSTFTSLKAQDADVGPIPAVFTCEGILIVEKVHKSIIPGYEKQVKKRI